MSALDPRERDLVKCEDMRIHAKRAQQFLGMRSLDEFVTDEMMQAAIVRCLEVIGEAARLVSEQTRKRASEIPWPLVIGMRHVLAHDYGSVDLDRVYVVATQHLPDLTARLVVLIRLLEKEVGWKEQDGSEA